MAFCNLLNVAMSMAKAHAIGLRKLTATGLFYLAGGSFTPSCDINSIWWSRKKKE
jgi:hypothetical protein